MSDDRNSPPPDEDWWLDQGSVTPDDIRRALQEAIDAGGDPVRLRRKMDEAMDEAGGTIEDLANAWTRWNRRRELLAAFREQLDRPKAWRRQ